MWHWQRSKVPADVKKGKPSPSARWGVPDFAAVKNGCHPFNHFKNQQLVLVTNLCGTCKALSLRPRIAPSPSAEPPMSLSVAVPLTSPFLPPFLRLAGASGTWHNDLSYASSPGSPAHHTKTSSCEAFVANNGEKMKEAYWRINSIKVGPSHGRARGGARLTTRERADLSVRPHSHLASSPSFDLRTAQHGIVPRYPRRSHPSHPFAVFTPPRSSPNRREPGALSLSCFFILGYRNTASSFSRLLGLREREQREAAASAEYNRRTVRRATRCEN